MAFIITGALFAMATLTGATTASIALWLAPLVFAVLCASLSRITPLRRVWLVLAGVGSQCAGIILSAGIAVLFARAGVIGRSAGIALFTVALPGAATAAVLFVLAHRFIVGTPKGGAPLWLAVLMSVVASATLGISAEFAQARPWILGNRLDSFPELSGPYILVWFTGLSWILGYRELRSLAA